MRGILRRTIVPNEQISVREVVRTGHHLNKQPVTLAVTGFFAIQAPGFEPDRVRS
nr:MAG TPA_asm: hypothetical protein [Caudoviricetes sp.]